MPRRNRRRKESAIAGEWVMVFTDGSCLRNPGGPGGWAALIRHRGKESHLTGAERSTTNNRMEMMAPIAALESLGEATLVRIYSDSKYVIRGATRWVAAWKRSGWVTAQGHPVKNKDLWERLDAAAAPHHVTWSWVKGHSGHRENELVDLMAKKAMRKQHA